MTRFLIKLKPLDTYFFGKEDKYRKRNGNFEADYFQKSAYFPQQTTLFGMLRYYVLLKNGQIPITNKEKATELIGKFSFDIGRPDPNFGTIKNMSAVFITDNNNTFYFKNPKDILLKNENDKEELAILQAKKAPFKANTSTDMLFFDNYKEKKGLSNFLIHSTSNYKKMNEVFLEIERVGIKKNEKGETDEKAFYKQIFYRLANGFSFGIIAELDGMKEHTGIVSMGAEKSPFAISFEKYEENLENQLDVTSEKHKILLLSDTFISNYNKADFQFAISTTKPFRFLKTEVKEVTEDKEYYSSDPIKSKKITRSDKYNLLEKGSVFYFKDDTQMDAFSAKLNSEKNFIQIGYNQHKKIN